MLTPYIAPYKHHNHINPSHVIHTYPYTRITPPHTHTHTHTHPTHTRDINIHTPDTHTLVYAHTYNRRGFLCIMLFNCTYKKLTEQTMQAAGRPRNFAWFTWHESNRNQMCASAPSPPPPALMSRPQLLHDDQCNPAVIIIQIIL